jgi:hypothetical protein
MRVTKLLALAAVAVVAVACNGIAPTSPNSAAVTSDDATALVGATALSVPAPPDCRDITEVELQSRGSDREITITAIYLKRGGNARCGVAPDWNASPRGRLTQTRDPFVVKISRTRPPTAVYVSAEAPNGVQGRIRVR